MNVGIFSLGVENNYNGSSNCSCGFWGVLELLAAIAIAVLLGFIFFRCVMAYCTRRQVIRAEKEQRKERWLEERMKRNKHTALQMSEECPVNHLHLPKYIKMSQIGNTTQNSSAPPSEVTIHDSGVFEQPRNVNFQS